MNNEFLKMTVDASIAAYMSDEKARNMLGVTLIM